jgi:Na+/proline symporter
MLPVAIIAGGGVSEVLSQLKAIDPQLTNLTAGFTNLTLLAYALGWFAFGFASSLSKPQVLVRLLAGRSPNEAKQAGWVYLAYVYSTWTAMVLFGMVCRVLIPNLDDPEQALPIYAAQNFNPFLIGIILAVVFSAIASTADSILLVCSSALARDISPTLYRQMSRRYGVKYEQAMTLLFGILAIPVAMFISTTVFSLVLLSGGALGGSLGPAMLIALLKRPTHHVALNTMMLSGLATTIIWRALGYHQIFAEVFPGFVVALLVHEILMRTVCQRLLRR